MITSKDLPPFKWHDLYSEWMIILPFFRDDDQVVVASSAIFRIYDIYENRFQERANLRRSKHNLNYSCNSVVWNKNDHNIVATGATNGAVSHEWKWVMMMITEHSFDTKGPTI